MKYQIIVESSETLSDDDFTEIIVAHLDDGYLTQYGFKFLYAQSLEGIRKELYERFEGLKEVNTKLMDNEFQNISDLFKL